MSCTGWTGTGARRTTCPSARSTFWTNPLLREPLALEHIKPRLLGTGNDTRSELHLRPPEQDHRRKRPEHDLRVRPGARRARHGREQLPRRHLRRAQLEISAGADGMKRLFKQFSFPGGIPSHVARRFPDRSTKGRARLRHLARVRRCLRQSGSGRRLHHRHGEAVDRPAGRVVALEQVSQPARDGAVLPILPLNGYKIANPTPLARMPREELESSSSATGTSRTSSRGRPAHHARPHGLDARQRDCRHHDIQRGRASRASVGGRCGP